MSKVQLLSTSLVLAMLLCLAPSLVQGQNSCAVSTFPWHETFADSARVACWMTVNNNENPTDDWTRMTNYGNGDNFSMQSGQGMPNDEWLISPPIVVPSDAGTNLRLSWYVASEAYYDILEGTYEVRISTNGRASVDVFTDSVFSETYSGNFVRRSLLLDNYRGEVIYIAFHNVSFFATSLTIDDVDIDYANEPVFEISGLDKVITPDTAFYEAVRVEGDTAGLNFIWNSRRATARQANMYTDGSHVALRYRMPCIDTLTLSVTNNYGSFTTSKVIRVISCDTIDAPFWETFDADDTKDCWRLLSRNSSDNDNYLMYSDSSLAHGGSGLLLDVPAEQQREDLDEWAISPAFRLPTDADGLVLSWYALSYAFMSPGSRYEVRMSMGSPRIQDFTTLLYTDSLSEGYYKRNVSLSQYGGRIVRFAFHNTTPFDGSPLLIDDMEIRFALEPIYELSGSSTVEAVVDTATIVATRIEGDTSTITFNWFSQMAQAGTATLIASGTTARVVYSQAGQDTITFIVANNHGIDTLRHAVRAFTCEPRSIPYYEGFEQDLDCWSFVDGTGAGNSTWTTINSRYIARTDNKLMLSVSTDSTGADDWAITPMFVLPTEAHGLVVSYYARTFMAGQSVPTVQLLLSRTDNALASFVDTLATDSLGNGWIQTRISLEQYAGDTVRFAFRNISAGQGQYVMIDDFAVRFANDPVYTINGDANVRAGDTATVFAIRQEGDTANLRFEWSSAFASAGNATMIPVNDTMRNLIYTEEGVDTITLVVTNNYASDTVTYAVRVYDCKPVSTFPWREDFEETLDCWQMVSNTPRENELWRRSRNNAVSGDYCLMARYNDTADVDHWAISPAIALPENDTNIQFSYYVFGTMWDSIETHYEVLVSTTDANLISFDSIFGETFHDSVYQYRNLNLTQYAGDTIYIAFRNRTPAGGDAMTIDDLMLTVATRIIPDDPVEVEEVAENPIHIYPNPARANVSVMVDGLSGAAELSIVDALGRTVMTRAMAEPVANLNLQILPRGIYFIRVHSAAGTHLSKLILQ